MNVIDKLSENLTEWLLVNGVQEQKYLDTLVVDTALVPVDSGTKYDYIFVMEEAGLFQNNKNSVACLKELAEQLKPDGVMAFIADNKYALDNIAGAYITDTGRIFEDGAATRGVVRTTLAGLAAQIGFDAEHSRMYYPYPNVKTPLAVYSDMHLPRAGELTYNYHNFGFDRLELLNETKMWGSVIQDGMFGQYANSFMLLMGDVNRLPVYVKYSNDRDEKYNICTQINVDRSGTKVIKRASGKQSVQHIALLKENGEKLTERYKGFEDIYGVKVCFNPCTIDSEGVAVFDYVEGITLEELLTNLAKEDKYEEFKDTVKLFADFVRYNEKDNIADIDLIFKNIFVKGKLWTIIDYEWTNEELYYRPKGLTNYIIQRAVYYFIADNPNVDLGDVNMYAICSIEKPQLPHLSYELDCEYEKEFQAKVRGDNLSLTTLFRQYGGKVYNIDDLLAASRKLERFETIELSDKIPFTDERVEEQHTLTIDMGGSKEVVIRPAKAHCFVYVKDIEEKGKLTANGEKLSKHLYVFDTNEPQITVTLDKPVKQLVVEMYVRTQGDGDSPIFEAVLNTLLKRTQGLKFGVSKIMDKMG